MRETQKQQTIANMNMTLAHFNEGKRLEDERKRTVEVHSRKAQQLDFFPFVSGEFLEEHRSHLKA